jgi:hypothetical protein
MIIPKHLCHTVTWSFQNICVALFVTWTSHQLLMRDATTATRNPNFRRGEKKFRRCKKKFAQVFLHHFFCDDLREKILTRWKRGRKICFGRIKDCDFQTRSQSYDGELQPGLPDFGAMKSRWPINSSTRIFVNRLSEPAGSGSRWKNDPTAGAR